MEIVDKIIEIGILIFERIQDLSFALGNNMVNVMEESDVPIMETLNKYLNIPDETIIKGLGFSVISLFLLMVRNSNRRYKRPRPRARTRARARRTGYGNYGQSHNKHDRLLMDQMEEEEQLRAHHEAVATHNRMAENFQDTMNNREQEAFLSESANYAMEDAYNASTPEDFGGYAEPMFDDHSSGFDDYGGGFDNHDSGFDNHGGGFDGF